MINGSHYTDHDQFLADLAKEKWPWHIPCGFIEELFSVKNYELRKQKMIAQAQAIASSANTDDCPDCSTVPENRLKERVIEVFHMMINPKSIHCLAKVQTSIKKRNGEHKYAYRFCYHHKGHCPHSLPPLKLKRKNV